jgi:mannose-6-phosphate isomerase-like protein (cupin superfamily)
MRFIALATTAVCLAGFAAAQQQAKSGTPALKLFASSSDVQALIAKAKAERKDNQPTVSLPILQLAPYNASLEYRASVGPAAVHEKEAEMFYVIDGSATLTTGGKLTAETRNGDNLTGTGIEGGQPRAVSKGDFIIVPEGTPHWFGKIDGVIVLMSLHVPRPVH